jgi:two-component system, NarL family, response regulator DesR
MSVRSRCTTPLVGKDAATTGSRSRIRVVLGDDGTGSHRALQALLLMQPDFDVVGVADDGEVALGLLRLLKPDIALLDADMASFGGAAVARVLKSELPDLQVVVLTSHESPSALHH